MIRLLFIILAASLLASCQPVETTSEKPYKWLIPDDFPRPIAIPYNEMSNAKVTLGRFLFYDKNMSVNQSQSCASCHQQQYAFAERRSVSKGATGQKHRRNAPALVNIAYNKTLTWAHDGLTSIERQVLIPLFSESPVELGATGNEQKILSRFNTKKYKEMTEQAFATEQLDFDLIVKALSSFTRSLISLNSPFDRYAYAMDDTALSKSALRGMDLFFSERLECHHCHGGFNFTQSTTHQRQLLDLRPFHNTGLYNTAGDFSYPAIDTGLFEVTGNKQDVGRFRAPTLRNIGLTAPYMHDGSIANLSQVIDFYAAAGRNLSSGDNAGDGRLNPLKSQFIKGFVLNKQEKNDLINFLLTLTDSQFITNPQHSNPFKE